jgi:poly(3-hydroxybutyrate) depolymerase
VDDGSAALRNRCVICKRRANTLADIGWTFAGQRSELCRREGIMLYQSHDISRTLLNPMVHLAGAQAPRLTSPFLAQSYMPFAGTAAAGCESIYRFGKAYDRQPFNLTSTVVDGRPVPVAEEIVLEKPFCTLLHFKKNPAAVPPQAAVLLVAPLAGHHATLLRDTVRELLKDHDVFLTDWTDARLVPLPAGPFGLGDYIGYVQDFMRLLGPGLHVIAICQSTVPVLAAISLMASENDPALPQSMTMIGGPIDARNSPTHINRLATDRPLSWFRDTMIHTVPFGHPGWGRRVYPGFIQHACFVSMHAERHAESYRDFYQRRCRGEPAGRHGDFYDEYNAILDMPAQFYLDTIEAVFQQCRLARGTWEIGGKPVRPQDIKTVALFTIEGERDDIAAPGQTAAALDLCCAIPPAKKKHFMAPDSGHYCIFSGQRWRQLVCPKIRSFIRANAIRHHAGSQCDAC